MGSLFQRFLSFDRLIGPALVRIVYYFGAGTIALFAVGALLTAIFSLAGGNFSTGLMQLLAAPAVAAVAFIYWRFLCELFMLAFLAFERMGEIRDLLGGAPQSPPAADPNHPQF